MMDITTHTSREELAAIVVKKLLAHQIEATLVGGSVVSIYTANKYASQDLDFISSASHDRIENAMNELGFCTKTFSIPWSIPSSMQPGSRASART
ncbi:MAG: nucleotidyltransferase [Candidatus Obscuribacterales bacterium]|nr:nucleotidyltransferase [Candidatus Obscuribacterales bacterium]